MHLGTLQNGRSVVFDRSVVLAVAAYAACLQQQLWGVGGFILQTRCQHKPGASQSPNNIFFCLILPAGRMERPVLSRTAAAVVLALLLWQSVDAARGNSLQDHILKDAQAAAQLAESMLPAWQEVTDEEVDMDSTRRLLAEYALNIADDEDRDLLPDTLAAAVVIEPVVPAGREVADENTDIENARRLLEEYALQAPEVHNGPEPVEHSGDSITLSRLLIEEADNSQLAEDSSKATQDTAASPEVDTTPMPDEDVTTSHRMLLQETEQAAGQAQAPAQDLTPAWQEVVDTMEASRKLMQAATANVTLLREQAKAVLLASDAFGLVYTGGNFARAIFALMTPAVVAGQTGTVSVDANYLLNLSQLLAQFVATGGDLLSKQARLTADGIAPV